MSKSERQGRPSTSLPSADGLALGERRCPTACSRAPVGVAGLELVNRRLNPPDVAAGGDVSPNATIEPFPSDFAVVWYGSGRAGEGGPVPTATYTARPEIEMPPKVAPPSGSLLRIAPLAASRAVSRPSESALYGTPLPTATAAM